MYDLKEKKMASDRGYLEYVLDQLCDLDDISYRPMMSEYILYYRGKVIGGIYDDRFLVKATESALRMIPDARMEIPYEGAREMLLIEDISDRAFMKELLDGIYDDLPAKKK